MSRYSNGFSSGFPRPPQQDDSSIADELRAFAARSVSRLWKFCRGRGRALAIAFMLRSYRQIQSNMSQRRLVSFPHLLVAIWLVVLLWGERWVFGSKVKQCQWDSWEDWPSGSRPHRVALVADPQLIDPHTYPGRPWPLSSLTVLITDNYLRQSYGQLVAKLQPDTIFFLGDLFDGGREWKTAQGDFADPEWSHRPDFEKKLLKKWNRQYGQEFWLREYGRFGDIFLAPWKRAVGHGQDHEDGLSDESERETSGGRDKIRGRRLVASLPGNHDLGFGSEVKMAVRNRFEAFFGEGNRVDVVGNHTFVSVDTVSLSAKSSEQRHAFGVEDIYKPTELFLAEVQRTKRKAVARELRYLRSEIEEVRFAHRIEGADDADFKDVPDPDPGEGQADLPSILLTHVPLYRPPGTPCGPLREHWPPQKPSAGQQKPVVPDPRNAITVAGGYQYQNVLNEEDSVDLVRKVGHVVHAFSGDDHDYCELRHDARHDGTPEITVKSISMAMGVPTPGFLLVSLHNPVDGQGRPLPGAPATTLQTHLCLLPRQLGTYSTYGALAFVSILLLAARAFLVPVLSLTPFALDPSSSPHSSSPARAGAAGPAAFSTSSSSSSLLPTHKAKAEDYYGRNPGASGFSASGASASSPHSRDRSQSGSYFVVSHGHNRGLNDKAMQALSKSALSSSSRPARAGGRWGWGGSGRAPPKIEIRWEDDDDEYDRDAAYYDSGKWKAASRGGTWSSSRRARLRSSRLALIGRELWTTTWRVAWMVVCTWSWLAWKA